MKTEWIVTLVLIATLVLVVLVVYIVDKQRAPTRRPFNLRAQLSRKTKSPPTPTIGPALAPIQWDKDEGAYIVRMRLGAGTVQLVIDTGSSQISAKGNDCQWTSCEDNDTTCVTKNCPCTGGGTCDFYEPQGRYVQPGQEGAGTTTTLVYGSQEDTVAHYKEHVSLPCVEATNCNVLHDQHHGMSNEYLLGEMIVHLVSHIKGASSSNLLGLARPHSKVAGKEYGKQVVVEKLLAGGVNIWALLLHKTSGWLVVGHLSCFPHISYVPMVDPAVFRDFATHFYIVPVVSLEVGASEDTLRKVQYHAPKYAIIDTGTTYTYGSPALGAELDRIGYSDNASFVRITLGTPKQSYVLTYSPSQLADADFPQSSVFQCRKDQTLPDFNDIFPDPDVLLFGVLMMQHMYWEFDLDGKRIGIAPL